MAKLPSSRIVEIFAVLAAWLLGTVGAYLLTSFFESAQASLYQLIFLPLLLTTLVALPVYFGLRSLPTVNLVTAWPSLLAMLLLGRFAYRVVEMSLTFPNLLPAGKFNLAADSLPVFAAAALAALGIQWTLVRQLPTQAPRLVSFLRQHASGLLLAALFFVVYFALTNSFNRQDFNTNNVFFAADSHQWQLRLAGERGQLMENRAIHPLAFLILRPAVAGVSMLFAAAPFDALLFLLALVGSWGIFLAWLFLKLVTGNATHAFLFAALLGLSTTNLVFNAVAETYIFSAFMLILFFVLLQQEARFHWLVLGGLTIFGITISNLVQSLVGIAASDLKLKRAARFTLWVVGLAAALNLVSNQVLPDSALFFDPAAYGVESQHYQLGSTTQAWTARATLVSSDMFLFSVVAPQPYLLETTRDVRGEFPKFNFMLGERTSQFTGLGKIAVWIWVGLLLAALGTFIYSLRQERFIVRNRLSLALLGCLVFNFVFHFYYGFEPFLYAANWTYALVLFAALGLSSFASHKLLQGTLLLLLAWLTLNNLSFLHFLMSGLSAYIPDL
ncbi:MAG: hypothetical protein WD740_08215 [Anaerolineales bacterium]